MKVYPKVYKNYGESARKCWISVQSVGIYVPRMARTGTETRGDVINDNGDNLRPNRTRSDRSNACEIRTSLGAQGKCLDSLNLCPTGLGELVYLRFRVIPWLSVVKNTPRFANKMDRPIDFIWQKYTKNTPFQRKNEEYLNKKCKKWLVSVVYIKKKQYLCTLFREKSIPF